MRKQKWLAKFMATHKLTNKDVGRILKAPPVTVRTWLCKSRDIPAHKRRLLELEVKALKLAA